MNKFEERTSRKKKSIIDAALKLFGEKGFINVSICEIAELAKVSQVSIYNYFGSKEALVTECALVVMKTTIENAEEILISNDSFENKLNKALDLCNEEINTSLSNSFSKEAITDKNLMTLLIKDINVLKKQIYLKYVALGKKEGVIDKAISDSTIELFIDSINNIQLSKEDMKEKQKEIIKLFLYGLIGDK
ncbi:MAG: TetR/AcrR family transcriptional regulator [Coprobacillaceae bacterium]